MTNGGIIEYLERRRGKKRNARRSDKCLIFKRASEQERKGHKRRSMCNKDRSKNLDTRRTSEEGHVALIGFDVEWNKRNRSAL